MAVGGPERGSVKIATIGEGLVGLVVLLAHSAPAGVVPGGDAHRVQLGYELSNVREPLLPVRQRNLRRDKGDAARAADDPGRRAACVLLDRTAARIGRTRVYGGRLERSGIEIALVVDGLQHHRVGGRDAVEILE